MIVTAFTPDKIGSITATYITRFLGCRLIKGVPTVWVLQDAVGKEGVRMQLYVKKNDDQVDPSLVYITTLADDTDTFHLFEQPPKFQQQSNIIIGK
jgi:hypothetical protein